MHRNFILLFSLLFFSTTSWAQSQPGVRVAPETLSLEVGETFEADIVTNNFQSMVNTSFSVNWNPNIIHLDTYTILLPPDLFLNDLFVDDGQFALIWNPSGDKPSFEDGTPILHLKFTGVANGSSPIEVTDTPTQSLTIYCDSTGTHEVPLEVIQNGTISVGTTSITTPGLALSSLKVLQNTPNPFHEHTLIPFTLTQSEYLTLNIFNLDGKSIFQYSNQYGEGTHYIRLEKEVFSQPGVYLYQVKTSDTLITKKLILVR